MVALVYVFKFKINGQVNPVFSTIEMSYFIASESLLRKTVVFMSANLLGRSPRTIQKPNTKNCGTTFVNCDKVCKKTHVSSTITSTVKDLTNNNGQETDQETIVVIVVLAFDSTKVPPCLQVNHAKTVIIGGVHPNH